MNTNLPPCTIVPHGSDSVLDECVLTVCRKLPIKATIVFSFLRFNGHTIVFVSLRSSQVEHLAAIFYLVHWAGKGMRMDKEKPAVEPNYPA